MKSFLRFACLLIACAVACSANEKIEMLTSKFVESLKQEGGSCWEESGFTEDEIASFKDLQKADLENEEVKEKVNKFGCLMACVHKKNGIMEDGVINIDKLNAKIDERHVDDELQEKMKTVAVECLEDVKELKDECQVGLVFAACTFKKLIE